MKLLSQIQNTHLFRVFVVYGHLGDACHIGRHTKLGHGHLLSVWKAPISPDTLEISHDSGFRIKRPANPIEL